MGKSQDTRRKLTLAYRRLNPLAQSPQSDRRERRDYGGSSLHYSLFPVDNNCPRKNPAEAGFFTR
jgi:hypothetical protein